MLKRPITYEDFNGNTVTDVFYFNISKPELIEMELEHKEGLKSMIEGVIAAEDNKTLIKIFKELVLMAYGEKSPDGKRFIKTDELRTEFSQTAAFSTLFMELATDDGVAITFLTGVLPRDMQGELEKAVKDTKDIASISPPNA